MKELETERLRLRHFTMDDLEDLHQILDVELQWAGRLLTVEERAERLQSTIQAYEIMDPFGSWAVEQKATRRLMGYFKIIPTFDYYPQPGDPKEPLLYSVEPELGYAFASEFWGQGYGTEAARAVIAYAFEALHLRRLYAGIESSNVRSQNLMKKVGMTLIPYPRSGWENRVLAWLDHPCLL
jgi:RimJ/RimL family protein N-acetyltransferase